MNQKHDLTHEISERRVPENLGEARAETPRRKPANHHLNAE
jgi:hypothetical protein